MASYSYMLLGPEHWNINHLAKLHLSSCLAKHKYVKGSLPFMPAVSKQ